MQYELVVRRVGAGEAVNTVYPSVYEAVQGRAELVASFRARGFVGQRNGAAHYRLTRRDGGRRTRLDVFIREQKMCWN